MIAIQKTGMHSGVENMNADVRSAMECVEGRKTPHLRLYGWKPSAISLGANQSSDLIDLGHAQRDSVDVVHRPTGGGAIFHAEELTYCLTVPLGNRTPGRMYSAITSALLKGLRHLAITADAEDWPTPFAPEGAYGAEPLCFSGIARDEVRVQGRKLIGSAQRLYRTERGERIVLQHGSILLGDAHAQLPRYISGHSAEVSERMSKELRERSTSVHELLGISVSFDMAAEAIAKGFEDSPDHWNDMTDRYNEKPEEALA